LTHLLFVLLDAFFPHFSHPAIAMFPLLTLVQTETVTVQTFPIGQIGGTGCDPHLINGCCGGCFDQSTTFNCACRNLNEMANGDVSADTSPNLKLNI
jgi:hypothetical protein